MDQKKELRLYKFLTGILGLLLVLSLCCRVQTPSQETDEYILTWAAEIESEQPDILLHIVTVTPSGTVVVIPTVTPEPLPTPTPELFAFVEFGEGTANADIQAAQQSAFGSFGQRHITVMCQGYEWVTTTVELGKNLLLESPFGVGKEEFCTQGGELRIDLTLVPEQ